MDSCLAFPWRSLLAALAEGGRKDLPCSGRQEGAQVSLEPLEFLGLILGCHQQWRIQLHEGQLGSPGFPGTEPATRSRFPSFQVFLSSRFYGAHFSSFSSKSHSRFSSKSEILGFWNSRAVCLLDQSNNTGLNKRHPRRTALESSGGSAQGPRRSLISGLVGNPFSQT